MNFEMNGRTLAIVLTAVGVIAILFGSSIKDEPAPYVQPTYTPLLPNYDKKIACVREIRTFCNKSQNYQECWDSMSSAVTACRTIKYE